ncbi:BamA/TamA family outer membrane protein [Lewinella sp. W8]|uniref:BamA/TamA family outer membrane protein n=1 Tax=Lewinella sp. W8 TaxID=2528208 RepID=UPI0010679EED|nr:BamA/TamA family outer membrane protein [Lewinella sp. W8]MTB52326.1 BamA/TamA family outer membrane protein [Lewinella sp. W8]
MTALYRLLPLLLLVFGAIQVARAQVPSTSERPGDWILSVTARDFDWKGGKRTFDDSLAVLDYLNDWVAQQRGSAFWEASVDSLFAVAPGQMRAHLFRGPVYTWEELRVPEDVDTRAWLRRAGYRPRRFRSGRPFRQEAWTALRDSLLVAVAESGYPFASVGLRDIDWSAPGGLTAGVDISPGPLVTVGQLSVPENARVRTLFLERYLGLRPGEAYRPSRIRRLTSRLNQLPYLTLRGQPKVTFRDSLAFIDLPVERRPASRFDFVIGVLPNSAQNNNRLLITGELNGELYNGFGQGERIALRFEQLRPQTQELALALDYPFLFGLPFGVEGELDLYRRDSSFLNLNWRLAATYLREGNDRLSFFWQNRRTVIPGRGSATDPVNPATTDTLGVSRSLFGVQLRRNRTDRRFSPRRGYTLDVSAAAGFRRLLDLPPGDSLAARGGQYQVEADLAYYFEPLNGLVTYLGLRGAGIFSPSVALPNEQYRLGGGSLLRGFDQQSVFATDYQILTAELRLLLGGNAYLFGFLDAARVNARNKAQPDLNIDSPLGFGAGVNFDTRAGIFGLSLALGRSNNIPLDLGAPKVHLGYLSVF